MLFYTFLEISHRLFPNIIILLSKSQQLNLNQHPLLIPLRQLQPLHQHMLRSLILPIKLLNLPQNQPILTSSLIILRKFRILNKCFLIITDFIIQVEKFYNGVVGIWTWFLPFSAEIDGFYGVLGEKVDVGWIGFWEVLLGLGWGVLLLMGGLAWLMAYLSLVFIILN